MGASLKEAVATLERTAVEDARRTAEWLVESVAGLSRAHLYAFPEKVLTPVQAAQIAEAVQRRVAGEPVQYILGEASFYGLRLRITPDVLIPRPETEELVEWALAWLRPLRAPVVVDAGTGSGCIALALKHQRPDARVSAFDISPAALAVARANAEALGVEVAFGLDDMLEETLEVMPERVDLLVSNPPYIPDGEADTLAPHVRDFEPRQALFSGPEPYRFYRALARHAQACLREGGRLAVETHADFAPGVAACCAEAGLRGVTVHRDLSGHERMVVASQ